MTIRLHPQRVAAEPQAIRWVTDVDLPAGRVKKAPGTIGPMLEYGVLTEIFVERRGVWTWLNPDQSWTDHGPRIRDALSAALDLPGWEIEEGSARLLGLIAHDVLDGELKNYVSSHGGHITVAESTATTLSLDFGGACEACPAAGSTLHDKIETPIGARYPLLTSVERVHDEHKRQGWLGIPHLGQGGQRGKN